MKKVFLSLPMEGRTGEAIKKTMSKMAEITEAVLGEEVEIINSFLEGVDYNNKPIACLGESIKRMQEADLVVKLMNYNILSRGCGIEYEVARAYGILTLTITDNEYCMLSDLRDSEEKNVSIKVEG